MPLKNKFNFAKITVILVSSLLLISCSSGSVSEYASNLAIDQCPQDLDDISFDARVLDSYEDINIKTMMEYERMFNAKIKDDIISLVKLIRTKAVSEENFTSIMRKVINKMQSNIDAIKDAKSCLANKEAGNGNIGNFIVNNVVDDIRAGIATLRTSYKNILIGKLPENTVLQDTRVYFCQKNDKSSSIRLGKLNINGLIHALLATIEIIYDTPISKIKINGDNIRDTSSLLTLIRLPKQFIVSGCWNQFKTSSYLYANQENLAENYFINVGTAYSSVNKGNYEKQGYQYNNWYVNSLKLPSEATPQYLLWAHRFYTKKDYIPANFINSIGIYDLVIQRLEPMEIKNYRKDIKPGLVVLMNNFSKLSTEKDSILNGIYGIVGVVMDYDPVSETMLVLTEYENAGTVKAGLGYDVISINNALINKEFYFFRPKMQNVDKILDDVKNTITPSENVTPVIKTNNTTSQNMVQSNNETKIEQNNASIQNLSGKIVHQEEKQDGGITKNDIAKPKNDRSDSTLLTKKLN